MGDGATVGDGAVVGAGDGPAIASVGVAAGAAWAHAVHSTTEKTAKALLRGGLELDGVVIELGHFWISHACRLRAHE